MPYVKNMALNSFPQA